MWVLDRKSRQDFTLAWIPAFAGMTTVEDHALPIRVMPTQASVRTRAVKHTQAE